jgi:hypothetical protein
MSVDVWECLRDHSSKDEVYSALITSVLHTISRVKPQIIEIITQMTPEIHRLKPVLLTTKCLKMVERILLEGKMELRPSLNRLIQLLHRLLGSVLIEHVSSNCLHKLMDIVNQGS